MGLQQPFKLSETVECGEEELYVTSGAEEFWMFCSTTSFY